MRLVLAIISIALAALMIGFGLLQRLVLAGQQVLGCGRHLGIVREHHAVRTLPASERLQARLRRLGSTRPGS